MTPRERAIEATWDAGAGDWTTVDRERLETRVEQAIITAVEEATKQLEAENAELRANLRRLQCGVTNAKPAK